MSRVTTILNLILLLVINIIIGTLAHAEFECSSAVLYRWKRADLEHDTHWSSPTVKASDQESAKKVLDLKIAAEKERALNDCRRQHENLSGCIAERFKNLNQTYQGLSFSARKLLEDAINKDCESELGQCLEAKSSEAQCHEIKSAAQEAAAAAAEAATQEGKEGDKKKEEKKKK